MPQQITKKLPAVKFNLIAIKPHVVAAIDKIGANYYQDELDQFIIYKMSRSWRNEKPKEISISTVCAWGKQFAMQKTSYSGGYHMGGDDWNDD